MRILVVADIRLYRDGLVGALTRIPDIDFAIGADSPAAVIATARRHRCDVALFDMSTPGNAVVARELMRCQPRVRTVALAVSDGDSSVVACAEAGILGYVSRDATMEQLVDALRAVRRGEAVCSARLTAGLLRHIATQASARAVAAYGPVQLTGRERDVLALIATGQTNKEIARSLSIEPSTVKNHVHSLLGKLGVATRREAVRVGASTAVATVPAQR